MQHLLQTTFIQLLERYNATSCMLMDYWHEIEIHYTQAHRKYHTLTHLQQLLVELEACKENIEQWDAVLFALYYHDIIYYPLANDNEEQSAEFAENKLQMIGMSQEILTECKTMILATKSHIQNHSNDLNYFLDADLAILGQSWIIYEQYYKKIREEYSIYPELIYKQGRKKSLQHFLERDRIYNTDFFYERYEMLARENIRRELEGL